MGPNMNSMEKVGISLLELKGVMLMLLVQMRGLVERLSREVEGGARIESSWRKSRSWRDETCC
jgi:hypothetical protein